MRSTHSQYRPKRRTLAQQCLYQAASLLFVALLAWPLAIGVTPAAAATCASLAGLALPDTTITAAEPIAAGTFTAPDGEVFPNLPAFCRIAATLTPTSDSNINARPEERRILMVISDSAPRKLYAWYSVPGPSLTHNRTRCRRCGGGLGRVGMWRGGGRLGMSVSAPFVWRCLSGSTIAPFPHP